MNIDEQVHFIVLLINKNKFDVQNAKKLYIEFNGKNFHGKYQPVKYLVQVVEYVCKDKQYSSNLPNLQDGKLLDDKDYLLQRIADRGTDKALAEYIKQHPKKALSGASALVRNIRAAQQVVRNSQDPVLETPFDIQNFNLTGLLKEWTEDPELYKKKSSYFSWLILVGLF